MLSKLLLASILVAVIAIPIWAARTPSPRRGLRRAVLWLLVFNLFYLLAVRVIYPRI